LKYRKRVPTALRKYIDKYEIIKVVKSKGECLYIDAKIGNALKVAKSNLADATKQALINEELKDYVEIKLKDESFRYFDAVKLYLEQSNVSSREYSNRVYFFNKLFPDLLRYVFEKNPVVSEITPLHLNKIVFILQKLPSINQLNLKRLSSYEIIVKAMKGEYENNKKLHVDTINKQVKRIRSLALFGFRSGLFSMTTAVVTVKHQSSAREQRKALTCEEINSIYAATANQEIKNFIDLMRYTGMRQGELGKYKMSTIEGVECFDLREAESLKTMSSFRIIPRHPKIKEIEFTYTFEHLSRQVKRLINENLEDTDKKTSYSLRHTFASELIKHDISSDIVSELLGHRHSGMTLSRYVKGYSVNQLYEAIKTL